MQHPRSPESTVAVCGNVTATGSSHETAFIDAAFGTEFASTQLNPFVGVTNLQSSGGLVANDGSALRFDFDAPKGTRVSFDYSQFFDRFATAVALVVLDGTVTTLADQPCCSGVGAGASDSILLGVGLGLFGLLRRRALTL